MKKKVVPRSGIDTEMQCGGGRFSHTKGWIFGYKLHLIASTGSVIVPLTADFTTANIPDNQMYSILTASLPFRIIKRILFMSADPGYDDHELYDLSTDMGFQLLVCPVKRYKNTPAADRIKLVEFYESNLGQALSIR
jgi:Transposase DDE domain